MPAMTPRLSTRGRPRRTIHAYAVEGSRGGEFPANMLWYDSAWPAGPDDAALIATLIRRDDAQILNLPRRVRIWLNSNKPPSARWATFGWAIVEQKP